MFNIEFQKSNDLSIDRLVGSNSVRIVAINDGIIYLNIRDSFAKGYSKFRKSRPD